MRLLLSSNTAWSLSNFQEGLMCALVADGHEVIAAAPADEYAAKISALGVQFIPLPMDNKGTNPFQDGRLWLRYVRLLVALNPSVVILYTIKPNIYGSLAARLLAIPYLNVITGLGTAFIRGGWLRWLVEQLYRPALAGSQGVFFLNRDDLELFKSVKLVAEAEEDAVWSATRPKRLPPAYLLPGSGVDLRRFVPDLFKSNPEPREAQVRFLYLGRLLWEKGVGEYVEAARRLRAQGIPAVFQILGFLDVPNPSAVPRSQVESWVQEGVIEYLGSAEDVRPFIAAADCIVLPSYREGVPRSLLEAAAMARPIITTDSVGCREAVEDGVTGFICRPRDAADLADKMARLALLPAETRQAMGRAGRAKMEREFDQRQVIDTLRAAIVQANQRRTQGWWQRLCGGLWRHG